MPHPPHNPLFEFQTDHDEDGWFATVTISSQKVSGVEIGKGQSVGGSAKTAPAPGSNPPLTAGPPTAAQSVAQQEPSPATASTNAVYMGAALQFTLAEFDLFVIKYGFTADEAVKIRAQLERQITILEAIVSVPISSTKRAG